jgi:hypothetical protein
MPLKGQSFRHVPAGSYALLNTVEGRWHFFEVNQPAEFLADGRTRTKWRLWTFLREIRSTDSSTAVRDPMRSLILLHIAENPYGAMTDYGKQVGECGKCHRTLTDPASIAKGIGPVCEKYFS